MICTVMCTQLGEYRKLQVTRGAGENTWNCSIKENISIGVERTDYTEFSMDADLKVISYNVIKFLTLCFSVPR